MGKELFPYLKKKKENYGKRAIPIFKENKKRKVMGKELFP